MAELGEAPKLASITQTTTWTYWEPQTTHAHDDKAKKVKESAQTHDHEHAADQTAAAARTAAHAINRYYYQARRERKQEAQDAREELALRAGEFQARRDATRYYTATAAPNGPAGDAHAGTHGTGGHAKPNGPGPGLQPRG